MSTQDIKKKNLPRTFSKHTKFGKIFLMVLTNQLMYLVNEEDLIKLCVLRKKSELYDVTKQSKN